MEKVRRYWNQNRKKIIVTIIVIAFIFILINVFNNLVRNAEENITPKSELDMSKPTTSIMTGTTVNEEKTDKNVTAINYFIDLCNKRDYKGAYELLSDNCKAELFNNNINEFMGNYYNQIFATPKSINIELWIARSSMYTYKITYYENNLLATGGEAKGKNYEDYITVETINNEQKLNISNFITKQEINKSNREHDIEISIDSKNVYSNYETYNITVKNNTNKTISISNGQASKDICIVDRKDVEYTAMINEIPIASLLLQPGYQRKITVRFNKLYDSERVIRKMKFSNIILDTNKYSQTGNSDKLELVIDI